MSFLQNTNPFIKKFLQCVKDAVAIIGIFILSLVICRFFLEGRLIEGHDGAGAFVKLLSMVEMISHGQWELSWQPDLYSGYGYPLYTFYPPLFYLIASCLAFIFQDVVQGLNWGVFVVFFLSGVSMYVLAREFWGRWGGFLAGVAYLLAPYHIVSMYVRCSYAELTSLVFLPLIAWGLYKISTVPARRYLIATAFFIGALLLSHSLISFIFLPLVALWGAILLVQKAFRLAGIKVLVALAAGVLLAVFYSIPVLALKGYINTKVLLAGYDFHDNFVIWWQLFKPSWGYGESLPGPGDGMSFQLGLGHLGLALAGVILFLIKRNSFSIEKKMILFYMLLIIGVSVFMTLGISSLIWEAVPPLSFIQFPFRYLTLVIFAMSFFCGALCFFYPRWGGAIAIAGLVVLFAVNIDYCRPKQTSPMKVGIGYGLAKSIRNLDLSEYLPMWVKQLPAAPAGQELFFMLNTKPPRDLSGGSRLKRVFQVEPYAQDDVALYNGFFFPGWKVFIDGREVKVSPHPQEGTMVFTVPQGSHEIKIVYTTIPIRLATRIISLVTLMGLLCYAVLGALRWRARIQV